MRRRPERLTLSAEHRAGPSIDALELRLRVDDELLALEVVEQRTQAESSPSLDPPERVRHALSQAGASLSLNRLRELCRLRKSTLSQALAVMAHAGDVIKTPDGYTLP